MRLSHSLSGILVATTSLCALGAPQAQGQDEQTREILKQMQRQILQLQEDMSEKDRQIRQLQQQLQNPPAPLPQVTPPTLGETTGSVSTPPPSSDQEALDQAIREMGLQAPNQTGAATTDTFRTEPTQPGNLRLIDVSLDLLTAVGGSTVRDESLETLQGGGHDPRKRGITVQNAELSLLGAVDPYFTGEAHIILFIDPLEGETVVELEEAFLTTTSLPWDLQLEAGFFFTEFGRLNPRHPHNWDWLDQPVINTRLFGPDGMRQAGAQLSWLAPLPWFSELRGGIQNPEGETMASFKANDEFFSERPTGGLAHVEQDTRALDDFVYTLRWLNAWELSDELTLSLGASLLVGPNATGPDGDTLIYGVDTLLKWRPPNNRRGWPFVTWQTEYAKRHYDVDPSNANFVTPELEDWGLYTQLLYGFTPGWAAGLRYEYASGSGASFDPGSGLAISRNADGFRDDRQRLSPLIIWQVSEFSRVRLQYNYDQAKHLEEADAHSVWLGFEILYGAHPAHEY